MRRRPCPRAAPTTTAYDDVDDTLLLPPHTRITSYCTQHRGIRKGKSLRRCCSDDVTRQQGFEENEGKDEVNECQRVRRGYEDIDAGVKQTCGYSSCLKKRGVRCTTRPKKHVNFHDATDSTYTTAFHHNPRHNLNYNNDDDDSITLDRQHREVLLPTRGTCRDNYNDAVVYEYEGRNRRRGGCRDASGNYDECKARDGERRRSSASTTASRQSDPTSSTHNYSSSCDLADNFNRLSLTSSCTSTSRSQTPHINNRHQQPRVARPRDALGRAAARRMLVYPPEGQTGSPLTVTKKWSNVACHVRGDAERGYRYKVYYVQAFESQLWEPDKDTGGPFHLDYNSTTDVG